MYVYMYIYIYICIFCLLLAGRGRAGRGRRVRRDRVWRDRQHGGRSPGYTIYIYTYHNLSHTLGALFPPFVVPLSFLPAPCDDIWPPAPQEGLYYYYY